MTMFGYTAASMLLKMAGAVKVKINETDHRLSYFLPNGTRQVIKFDSSHFLPVNQLESHVGMLEGLKPKTLH